MDLVSLAVSGLVGAVLGSVIAMAGAFLVERWRRRRDEIGAARALYFEMVDNALRLEGMAQGGTRSDDLRRDTWDQTLAKVATLPFAVGSDGSRRGLRVAPSLPA
jgi:uncharacterized membrane protein YccC